MSDFEITYKRTQLDRLEQAREYLEDGGFMGFLAAVNFGFYPFRSRKKIKDKLEQDIQELEHDIEAAC